MRRLTSSADQLAEAAAQPLCRGFAVGRTIFGETARDGLPNEIDDDAAIEAIAQRYSAADRRRFADCALTRYRAHAVTAEHCFNQS